MQKTCIVIPCYNEYVRLPVDLFEKYLISSPCHFLFVNDASEDKTLMLLQNFEKLSPNKVSILNLEKNSGKGEAVRQGILAAISMDRFETVGYLDADLATPLEEIEYLYQYLNSSCKVVMGCRLKRLGASIIRNPFRHYLGRTFATIASLVLNIKVYDSQCGAKLFKISIAEFLFSTPFHSKWLFDLELIDRLKKRDLLDFKSNIVEVPLRSWNEKKNSRMKLWDFLKAPYELLLIKRNS